MANEVKVVGSGGVGMVIAVALAVVAGNTALWSIVKGLFFGWLYVIYWLVTYLPQYL